MKDESFGFIPIYKDNNVEKFLLVKHSNGDYWAFPKGHKEAQETPLEASKREFFEETGINSLEIPDLEKIFKNEYSFERNGEIIEKTVTYFIAYINDPNIQVDGEEIKEAGWFTYEEALETLTYTAGKELLKEVKEYFDKINTSTI